MRKAVAWGVFVLLAVCPYVYAGTVEWVPDGTWVSGGDGWIYRLNLPQAYVVDHPVGPSEQSGITYLPYYGQPVIEDDPIGDRLRRVEDAIEELDAHIDRIRQMLDAIRRARGVE